MHLIDDIKFLFTMLFLDRKSISFRITGSVIHVISGTRWTTGIPKNARQLVSQFRNFPNPLLQTITFCSFVELFSSNNSPCLLLLFVLRKLVGTFFKSFHNVGSSHDERLRNIV